MVCRKYCKTKTDKFNVNYDYKITKVTGGSIELDRTYILPIAIVKKYFTFDYCRTAHSFQGSSIDSEITIFDYKFCLVDRKWLYTSITRATSLENVYFLNTKRNLTMKGR